MQIIFFLYISEAVAQRGSVKEVFLKFRKIHSKTPVLESQHAHYFLFT